MLKNLTKSGEYTHFLIIITTLAVYYFTPSISFDYLGKFPEAAPIGSWIIEIINPHPVAGKIINILLMFLIALMVKSISSASDILPRKSYLSSTLLIFFLLFSPAIPYFTCTLAVVLLLAFSLSNYVEMFSKHHPFLQVLNASLAISLSSMIIPNTIIFILFLWIGFLTYSVNSWREWMISVIGLVLPYVYMVFAFFWNNNLTILLDLYTHYVTSFKIIFTQPPNVELISISLLIIIYILTLMKFINEASDKIISIRKRMWLTFQFSFITVLTLLSSGDLFYLLMPVLFIPMSLMLGYSLHNQRKSTFYDVIIMMLIVSILFNRFLS